MAEEVALVNSVRSLELGVELGTLIKKNSPAKRTGAADSSASEMYEQCLPMTGKNFSPRLNFSGAPNFEAVPDGRPRRTRRRTAASGAHRARVTLTFEPRTLSRPCEAHFLFASFSLCAQRERRFKTQKKFIRRMKATMGSACPLLKKRGHLRQKKNALSRAQVKQKSLRITNSHCASKKSPPCHSQVKR